ncbi:L-threonylcarbamoyladenylate synthase [Streptococcus moroccensis]|uniref:L-threonylcarbamoyladenylate synthase n=1 Tax=Streptococcus moroccensis TaxID=1451356 RepID=A0ABT9YRI5_9STRE|nr:L-threonylcarbamoyladenylate synthase [Streptococcus moroccensis]MDQ0221720.1 L-threonylcarbamoyladenylate synthase [Streptococcus moroccensis]
MCQSSEQELSRLVEIIGKGGSLILPTETVYGLFADALSEDAVRHVYKLKQRPVDKAMNLNVATIDAIYAFSKEQPDFLPQLFDHFLPGPLTIILKANEHVPVWVNSGLDTVGFRLPNHPVTREIIKRTGPLIGPSANVSGASSGKVYEEIKSQFEEQLFGFADDEAITGQDSTILDLSGEYAKILRQGLITEAELKAKVPQILFEPLVG